MNATSLVLTYDEALDAASVPATTDFAIGTSGAAQPVSVGGGRDRAQILV